MKRKLLEQKERVIIESFAKTFNKIKRLYENKLNEMELSDSDLFLQRFKELASGFMKASGAGLSINDIRLEVGKNGFHLQFAIDGELFGGKEQSLPALIASNLRQRIIEPMEEEFGVTFDPSDINDLKVYGRKYTEKDTTQIGNLFFRYYIKVNTPIDENYMGEALDVTQHLKVGDRLEKINTSTPDTLTIVKIDGNKLFIKSDATNHEFQWTLDSVDDEIKRGKLKWLPKNEAIAVK
jgi:hypothetical protein